MHREQADSCQGWGWGLGLEGGGIEQKRKKERQKLMDVNNSVVIARGKEGREGGGGYRGDKW